MKKLLFILLFFPLIVSAQWIIFYFSTNANSLPMGMCVEQTQDGGYIAIGQMDVSKGVDILGRDVNPEKNKPFIEIYNDGSVEKKIIIE